MSPLVSCRTTTVGVAEFSAVDPLGVGASGRVRHSTRTEVVSGGLCPGGASAVVP